MDKKHEKLIKYGISFLIFLMVLPSGYFAYKLFKEQQFVQSVNVFVDQHFINKGYTLVYKKTNYYTTPKNIELAFLSKRFSKAEIDSLNEELNTNHIQNTKLIIRQDSADKIQLLRNNILNEIKSTDVAVSEKDKKIQ